MQCAKRSKMNYGIRVRLASPIGSRLSHGPPPVNRSPDGQITRGSNFLSSPVCKNIWLSPSGKSNLPLAPSCSERGALRNVTKRGAGCGGRGRAADERHGSGRRSRVVLTPRRWRQASEKCLACDGDNQARSPGRSRRKPLKPLRAGMPGDSGEPVVTTLVCFLFLHARLRVHRAPGIPHALSYFSGATFMHHSGVKPPRDRGGVCRLLDVVV